MPVNRQKQTQGGQDSTTSVREKTVVESSRETPEQTTISTQEPVTNTTRQKGTTSTQRTKHRMKVSLSFSIQVVGNLPPITS